MKKPLKKIKTTKPCVKKRATRRWLFDRALPISLRDSGQNTNNAIPQKPATTITLQTRSATLSPHVLSLRPIEPTRVILPTFVESSEPIPTIEDVFAPVSEEIMETPVTSDLFTDQLSENDCTPSRTYTWHLRLPTLALPSLPKFSMPTVPHIPTLPALPRLRLPSMPAWTAWQTLSPAFRGAMAFVVLSFAFVLPLHAMNNVRQATNTRAQVTEDGAKAMQALTDAAAALKKSDPVAAGANFADASAWLNRAQKTFADLDGTTKILASLFSSRSESLRSARTLTMIGADVAEAARIISEGFGAAEQAADPTLTTKIALLSRALDRAAPHVSEAADAIASLSPDEIPEAYRASFSKVAEALPAWRGRLQDFRTFADTLLVILGDKQSQRYLVLFQNQTELRPTGGFIGSYAEVTLRRGTIESLRVPGEGSYDRQGSLQAFVASPKPLSLINARWEFQDANWSPDFHVSADKLLWFDREAGGATKDGVIAINASFVEDLLRVLGPVEMPAYDLTITAGNFLLEAQRQVEVEYDRAENKPKQFIADLAPILLNRITNADTSTFLALLEVTGQALAQKDIQLSFTNSTVQETMRTLRWTGEMARPSGDYLLVADANIGGQKTDAVIDEDVSLSSRMLTDGTIRDTVTITRTHRGIAGALFTGANNVNYVRLYVPRGTTLVSAEGTKPPLSSQFETRDAELSDDRDVSFFEASAVTDEETGVTVGEESGKTVIGGWMQTRPGETSTLTFTYDLPWTWGDKTSDSIISTVEKMFGLTPPLVHSLTIEAQAGTEYRTTRATISFPIDAVPIWSTGALDQGVLRATIEPKSGGFIAALFE